MEGRALESDVGNASLESEGIDAKCPYSRPQSHAGVHRILRLTLRVLFRHCQELARIPTVAELSVVKRVTIHILRHTMALDLLQAGVDRSVIALWLGPVS